MSTEAGPIRILAVDNVWNYDIVRRAIFVLPQFRQ